MGEVTLTLEEYEALRSRLAGMDPVTMGLTLAREGQTFPPTSPEPAKKKRKVSKYNRQYAKEYRIHREKHPRMSHAQITKLAHKATKKALK